MAHQVNLLNPKFLRQKKQFSARAMLHALGLIAVGALAFSAYLDYRVRQSQVTLTRVAATAVEQQAQVMRLGSEFTPQGRSKLLEEELARVSAQVSERQALLGALKTEVLGNRDGFSPFLQALARQTVAGVWLTGVRVDGEGNELAVDGRALDASMVPAYLRALNRDEVMRGRQVASLAVAAKESTPAAATKSGEPPAAAPAVPERFVEFKLVAARNLEALDAAGKKPAP